MNAKQAGGAPSDMLREIVEAELLNLPRLLEELPPADRVKALIQMLQYTAPRMLRADVVADMPKVDLRFVGGDDEAQDGEE